jgi:ATP-binding cassette subfamily B protein
VTAGRQAARASLARIVAPRWHIAKLAPGAGRTLTAGCVLLSAVRGALPIIFLVAASELLGNVPAAVRDGTSSAAWHELVTAFVIAGAAALLQQVLTPVQTALGELVTRRVDGRTFQRLMSASTQPPSIAALENQEARDHLAEAARELEYISQGPGRACAGLLALVARYVELTGYVIAVGAGFSWLAAAALMVVTLTFRYGQRGGLRKYAALFPTLAAVSRKVSYLREVSTSVAAGKEIRIFGLVDWLASGYRAAYRDWMTQVWAERRRIYLKPYLWLTAAGLTLTAAVLAGVGASASSGLDLTHFALVAQAVLGALRLGDHYPEADVQTQFGMIAFNAVRAFEGKMAELGAVPAHPEPRASVTSQPVGGTAGTVTFDDVSFSYPGGRDTVFEGLRLTIPAGCCTAIVGVNGAGKTTLVKLLARLYEPSGGRILVGGVDLADVALDTWRRQLGVIFQDFLRFQASAADNIAFGAVEHLTDRDGIIAAARAAGIGDVLTGLSSGLDTPLSRQLRGGAELSGGQWQRVAIARALFALEHGARMLILDEPTASLDIRAEAHFYAQFVGLTRGVTSILISHRLSTVRIADNIVVLQDKRVAEQGTHEELMRRQGRYAQLFQLQAAWYTGDERGSGGGQMEAAAP